MAEGDYVTIFTGGYFLDIPSSGTQPKLNSIKRSANGSAIANVTGSGTVYLLYKKPDDTSWSIAPDTFVSVTITTGTMSISGLDYVEYEFITVAESDDGFYSLPSVTKVCYLGPKTTTSTTQNTYNSTTRFSAENRQLSNLVYQLKMAHSSRLTVRQNLEPLINYSTGQVTQRHLDQELDHAVVLVNKMSRIISAIVGGNFDYGGVIDMNARYFLVDGADLKEDLNPDMDYSIIYNAREYKVKSIKSTLNGIAYIIEATDLKGMEDVNKSKLV